MLDKCLIDLISQLQNFNINSATIEFNYNTYSGELYIKLSQINGSNFWVNDFDEGFFQNNQEDPIINSELLEYNLKFSELYILMEFIQQFKYEYSCGIKKIIIASPKWWEKIIDKLITPLDFSRLTYEYKKN